MKPKYWNKGRVYLSKKDPILKIIINKYNKENLNINKNYFYCLINSIIGQQISVKAASSIKTKFFSIKKNIKPNDLIKIKDKEFKKIGLSRQKISYIKNIANFFILNKEFIKKIENFNEKEIRDKLILIKGVGPWTIDMFLIFGIGMNNVFPKGDLGFLNAISNSYKKKLPISEKYLEKLYKKWSPYNTIATWYLWRSLDPIPVTY